MLCILDAPEQKATKINYNLTPTQFFEQSHTFSISLFFAVAPLVALERNSHLHIVHD